MNMQRLMQSLKADCQRSSAESSGIRTIDKSIPVFRTVFIVAGLAGAALNTGPIADHLFAAGLLLHFSIWFEGWWRESRTN